MCPMHSCHKSIIDCHYIKDKCDGTCSCAVCGMTISSLYRPLVESLWPIVRTLWGVVAITIQQVRWFILLFTVTCIKLILFMNNIDLLMRLVKWGKKALPPSMPKLIRMIIVPKAPRGILTIPIGVIMPIILIFVVETPPWVPSSSSFCGLTSLLV